MQDSGKIYMHRCLELAGQASGYVAPNPMVGAILVHNGRIIGEGYHRYYGQAHAEVNCIESVKKADQEYIRHSVLYVSLEPCAHFGKTPPCADLIIEKNIPRVVVGCTDPYKTVDGSGIKKLLSAGVEVKTGVLKKKCKDLNKRFLTFHTKHRPYIILKWAESSNGNIAQADFSRSYISGDITNRLVHKWRSEEASILVGARTALADNPELNVRLWNGPDPVRLVVDKDLSLPARLNLFDGQINTIRLNTVKNDAQPNLLYYKMRDDLNPAAQVSEALYKLNILSVLVEGGRKTLQSFLDEELWDEIKVIKNESMAIESGIPAPIISGSRLVSVQRFYSEQIYSYHKA
jgi:diaminohydroxyphosphoribosylaminopyrimidine deaminase/5-amino-6-(5-phosphoribosylamino)uracil reductase